MTTVPAVLPPNSGWRQNAFRLDGAGSSVRPAECLPGGLLGGPSCTHAPGPCDPKYRSRSAFSLPPVQPALPGRVLLTDAIVSSALLTVRQAPARRSAAVSG